MKLAPSCSKKAGRRQDGPAHVRVKLQVGQKKGQDEARWAPKGPRQDQGGPKIGQEGCRMGTKKGQESAREAQVGSKMDQLWACFVGLFSLQAVF